MVVLARASAGQLHADIPDHLTDADRNNTFRHVLVVDILSCMPVDELPCCRREHSDKIFLCRPGPLFCILLFAAVQQIFLLQHLDEICQHRHHQPASAGNHRRSHRDLDLDLCTAAIDPDTVYLVWNLVHLFCDRPPPARHPCRLHQQHIRHDSLSNCHTLVFFCLQLGGLVFASFLGLLN